jgi:hypothetical protein
MRLSRLNKAAPPNRRLRFAFATSRKLDYRFWAPPPLSAAVGEPQRSTNKFLTISDSNSS